MKNFLIENEFQYVSNKKPGRGDIKDAFKMHIINFPTFNYTSLHEYEHKYTMLDNMKYCFYAVASKLGCNPNTLTLENCIDAIYNKHLFELCDSDIEKNKKKETIKRSLQGRTRHHIIGVDKPIKIMILLLRVVKDIYAQNVSDSTDSPNAYAGSIETLNEKLESYKKKASKHIFIPPGSTLPQFNIIPAIIWNPGNVFGGPPVEHYAKLLIGGKLVRHKLNRECVDLVEECKYNDLDAEVEVDMINLLDNLVGYDARAKNIKIFLKKIKEICTDSSNGALDSQSMDYETVRNNLHKYWKDIFDKNNEEAQVKLIMNITSLVKTWIKIFPDEKEGEGDKNLVVHFEILSDAFTIQDVEEEKKKPIYVISKLENKTKQQYQDSQHPQNQLQSVR